MREIRVETCYMLMILYMHIRINRLEMKAGDKMPLALGKMGMRVKAVTKLKSCSTKC